MRSPEGCNVARKAKKSGLRRGIAGRIDDFCPCIEFGPWRHERIHRGDIDDATRSLKLHPGAQFLCGERGPIDAASQIAHPGIQARIFKGALRALNPWTDPIRERYSPTRQWLFPRRRSDPGSAQCRDVVHIDPVNSYAIGAILFAPCIRFAQQALRASERYDPRAIRQQRANKRAPQKA